MLSKLGNCKSSHIHNKNNKATAAALQQQRQLHRLEPIHRLSDADYFHLAQFLHFNPVVPKNKQLIL